METPARANTPGIFWPKLSGLSLSCRVFCSLTLYFGPCTYTEVLNLYLQPGFEWTASERKRSKSDLTNYISFSF